MVRIEVEDRSDETNWQIFQRKESTMKTVVATVSLVFCVMHALCDIPHTSSYEDFYDGDVPKWRAFSIEGVPTAYGCVIVPFDNAAGEVVVPSHLGGRPVLGLARNAFQGTKVTSVVLPEGLIEIGERGFCECGTLQSVAISSSVTNIGCGAFIGCTNLLEVTIPEGVREIRDECFKGCISLQSVSLPSTTTNIGSQTFSGCRNLSNLMLSEGLERIGNLSFSGCYKITDMTFPISFKAIVGSQALGDCYRLTNVTFRGDAPRHDYNVFNHSSRDLIVHVPVGSKGWDGNPESTALPKYWPYNTEGGRRIVHIGETVNDEPPVVTNYVYSTVTNYIFSTVTNEVFHYSTVTNEIFHYTTVTNVVKYVPEPGASPDAGYGINVGAGGETVIAGAAGWDAFGVPDGMEWNKETGTLSGRAKLSGAYDLILVSGSGADTKIMRTTLTVAPYDTIVGYVGVAFSQSGAPLDNLKSYKMLPAGLKWVSSGRGATALPGVLQGAPTKAQALDLETADGEPVKIEIKALPDSVVGTFDGCVYFPPSDPTNGVANTCDIGGTITLTATAAGKISASVKTAKKTYSFSMASWAKFAEGDAFTLEASAELKTVEVLEVNATVRDGAAIVLAKLSGGEFDGHAGRVTLPGDGGVIDTTLPCVTILEKDVYAKSGSKWIDEDAHALMAKCAGTYQFGFDAVESGGVIDTALPAWTLRPVAKVEAAFLKVVLKDTGVATITGTLPDKTKINLSAKATASAVDGSDKVEIKIVSAAFSGKTTTLPIEVNLMNDGSFAEGRANCGIIYSVKR